jgi:hypothetical protein
MIIIFHIRYININLRKHILKANLLIQTKILLKKFHLKYLC